MGIKDISKMSFIHIFHRIMHNFVLYAFLSDKGLALGCLFIILPEHKNLTESSEVFVSLCG
ncbi:hypothetical protein CL652_00790 [bacterium]|nr:hypothetical protein [bacterium]